VKSNDSLEESLMKNFLEEIVNFLLDVKHFIEQVNFGQRGCI